MINSPSVMIMKAVLLLPLLRCAADLDFHARMQASLEASLAQYPAVPKSTEAVSRYLAGVLFAPTFSVLVYEGRLFVDRRFLGAEKNRKHANFVASALAHEHVHNAAYFFSGNSTGLCDRDRDRDAPVAPCLVIAKVGGHGMRGVLVPNPYFQDVGYWDAVRSHVRARAATRPFAGRDPRLFWRGHISSSYHAPGDPLHPEPCADEFGNHARLEAMAAGLRAPETVDVKCWILSKRRAGVLGKRSSRMAFSESSSSSRERSAPNRRRRSSALRIRDSHRCHPRDDRDEACAEYPYDATMAKARDDPALVTDPGHVAKENFTQYKYVLNLPGSTAGSYSRNLNHLWFLRSVVVFWKAPFVEWYFPALSAGETHLVVDAANVSSTVDALNRGAIDVQSLLRQADRVDDELLCPRCLARYFKTALAALSRRFSLAKVLDDPCVAELFFEHLDCAGLDLVEVKHTVRAAGSYDIDARRSLLTSTASEPLPGGGCAELTAMAGARCNATHRDAHRSAHKLSVLKGLWMNAVP